MKFNSYGDESEYFELLDDDKHAVVSFRISPDRQCIEILEECDHRYEAKLNHEEINYLIKNLTIMKKKII